jgi:hypothetical protein
MKPLRTTNLPFSQHLASLLVFGTVACGGSSNADPPGGGEDSSGSTASNDGGDNSNTNSSSGGASSNGSGSATDTAQGGSSSGSGGADTSGDGGTGPSTSGDGGGRGGTSTSSDSGGSSSGAAGGQGGGPGTSPCPATLPESGDPCSIEQLVCQYGDDPRTDQCNRTATCVAGGWGVTTVNCDPPVEVDCPSEPADQEPCPEETALCVYDRAVCTCATCTDEGPVGMCDPDALWRCQVQTDEGCPAIAPNLGSACDEADLLCPYGGNCGISRLCNCEYWEPSMNACAISTREAKQDIAYLDRDALSQLAEQALGVRLASYRYREPLSSSERRLGFIIEDSPDLPAVDERAKRVDLYAYASMVLALGQVQAERIRELEARIQELEAGSSCQSGR